MTTAPPVKPDATPEEVRAVVEDDQGGQIFSQAVGSVVLTCMSMS
jgi:t-SNARE complex subunit (syntaxin)